MTRKVIDNIVHREFPYWWKEMTIYYLWKWPSSMNLRYLADSGSALYRGSVSSFWPYMNQGGTSMKNRWYRVINALLDRYDLVRRFFLFHCLIFVYAKEFSNENIKEDFSNKHNYRFSIGSCSLWQSISLSKEKASFKLVRNHPIINSRSIFSHWYY